MVGKTRKSKTIENEPFVQEIGKMIYFFSSEITEKTAVLRNEEARHCIDVIRLKIGDEVWCTDGAGLTISGVIDRVLRSEVYIEIQRRIENFNEPLAQTGLLFTPLKQNDRTEYLLEKAVELGVTHLFPVVSARTEKHNLNRARLEKIIVSALKQSTRSRLPYLAPLQTFKQVFATKNVFAPFDLRLFAHCDAQKKLNTFQENIKTQNLILAIGPVGDFTKEEIEIAEAVGFHSVSFGTVRLRSETSATFALAYNKAIKEF